MSDAVEVDDVIPGVTEQEAPAIIAEAAAPVAAPEEPRVTATDLARFKQRADRLRQQELEVKRASERAAAVESQYKSELESLKALASSDPIAFLERTGVSFDDLAFRLSGQPEDPNKEIRKELESVKKDLARRAEDERRARDQEHWDTAFDNFHAVVESDPNLELLREEIKTDPENVMGMIQRMAQISTERGVQLTYKQAAQQYEDYLFDQFSKYAKTGKAGKLLAPTAPVAPKTEQAIDAIAKTEDVATSTKATLSNQVSAEPAPRRKPMRVAEDSRQRELELKEERRRQLLQNIGSRK